MKDNDDHRNEETDCLSHCVLLQGFAKILCTFTADLIVPEVECGECLYEMRKMMVIEMKKLIICLTVFFCKPSLTYFAPSSPI